MRNFGSVKRVVSYYYLVKAISRQPEIFVDEEYHAARDYFWKCKDAGLEPTWEELYPQ
jgi:hypothetical protein